MVYKMRIEEVYTYCYWRCYWLGKMLRTTLLKILLLYAIENAAGYSSILELTMLLVGVVPSEHKLLGVVPICATYVSQVLV